MTERIFTIEQANEALSEVEPLAREMVEARARLEQAREHQEQIASQIAGNGGGLPPHELAKAQEELERWAAEVARSVEAIHRLGAQVKDLEEGLVDFPSLRDGEQVLLCWRLGESEITHWHGLEEGFSGRTPL